MHVEYQKACTGADKFNGDTGRGPRPPKGVKGPKKEAESLQRRLKAPQQPSTVPKYSSQLIY